jgi:hypothetical protein
VNLLLKINCFLFCFCLIFSSIAQKNTAVICKENKKNTGNKSCCMKSVPNRFQAKSKVKDTNDSTASNHEGMVWNLETCIRGASERLPSILMTALVTALGLLPLAIGSGEPGREIEGPMASIIVGGLVTSTILNLLILPTIMLHFGRFEKHQQT